MKQHKTRKPPNLAKPRNTSRVPGAKPEAVTLRGRGLALSAKGEAAVSVWLAELLIVVRRK
jgi:hypothetical protein